MCMTKPAITVLSRKSFPSNPIFLRYLKKIQKKGEDPDIFGLSVGARSVVFDKGFRTYLKGRINLCIIKGAEIPESIQDEKQLFTFLADKNQTGLKHKLLPLRPEDAFCLRLEKQPFWKCKNLLVLHKSVLVNGDIVANRWLILHRNTSSTENVEKDFVGSIFPRDFFADRKDYLVAVGFRPRHAW